MSCRNFDDIKANYERICFNVNEAIAKYRNPDDIVNIMAVTKTVEPEFVNYAVSLGIKLLGENRVQEFLSKKDFYDKNASVHFIGHLQTNKVKYIINDVDLIQSVDSIKLLKEIDRLSKINNKVSNVLLEVNIGKEESKSGFYPEDVYKLIYEISEFKNLKVQGLMTIPPKENPEQYLEKIQGLYLDIKGKNIDNINMNVLSMGMSSDYEKAIKYGSNLLRIGTKLFGVRDYMEVK